MTGSPHTAQISGAGRLWRGIWLMLGALLLAGVGIAAGLVMGRKIAQEEWAILVTATGLATYIAVAVTDVRHALLFWVATAPFARFTYLNIELGRGIPNLTLNRIMTGVLLVLVLAQAAIGRRRLVRFTGLDALLLAFLAAAALSVPSAIVGLKSAVQSFLDLLIIPVAIYFLARNLITDLRALRGVMVMLTIVGLYFALLATREQLTGDVWFYPEDRSVTYTASIRRVVGLLGNPAYIAVTISMTWPWAWYWLYRGRRFRLGKALLLAVMAAGVFFCMNRSGWGGLVLALVVMAIFIPRFRRTFFILLILAVIVGSIYGAVILSSATVRERLKAQGPIEYRRETWDIARRMIRDHPIFGLGYENFPYYYRRYGHWDIYLRAQPTPHNTYLWVLLMGGIIAFIPFMAFLLYLAWTSLKLYRSSRSAESFLDPDLVGVFLASMAAIFAPAFVMDVLTGYYNTMIMFMIMGAFWGAVAGERQRAERARLAQMAARPLRG